MIAILIIVLMAIPIRCESLCSVVKPNGTYGGLGIYKEYNTNGSEFRMGNKAGNEWVFDINHINGNYTLEMNETTLSSLDEDRNVLAKFGIIVDLSPSLPNFYNCKLRIFEDRSKEFQCNGTQITTTPFENKFNGVVIYIPFEHKNSSSPHVFLFNPENSHDYYTFYPRFPTLMVGCEEPNKTCVVPDFINKMNASLFERIEGIVGFDSSKSGGKIGHLILFQIDGRPKYCITFKDESLSDECKSPQEMPTLFSECFETTPPTKKQKQSLLKNPLFWATIALGVIAIFNSIGLLFVIDKRKRVRSSLYDSTANEKTISTSSSSVDSTSSGLPKGLSKLNALQK